MLPVVPEKAELQAAYEVTIAALQSFITNSHMEWFESINNSISKELDRPLLIMDKATGLVSVNFDPNVLCMLAEVHLWERAHLPIPYVAMEIQA